MLFSVALILLVGMAAGWMCRRLKLPGLLGMIVTGILLGPYMLDCIDSSILNISADLRKIALIIILTRAGLTLNLSDLKKVGRPAVLMCFLPASFEILGMVLLAPKLLGVPAADAALIGSVVAAVSPAVVVPKMIKLTAEGYGTEKGIPQLILAGASVDDVFVIVLFTAFTGIAAGNVFSAVSLLNIPLSILLGAAAGLLAGFAISAFFRAVHIRDTAKVIILLCVSFLLVTLEDSIAGPVSFSALIAVMFIGIGLQKYRSEAAQLLSVKFNQLWVGAEILLFVLVGATVDVRYITAAGAAAVLLIALALCFRMAGVLLCLTGTALSFKERVFCMIGYMPKATVQAAIGGMPLAMGLACGNIVLTVAVLSILITAPLGAFAIDLTYRKLLSHDGEGG